MLFRSQASLAWARPDFNISGYTKIWLVGAGIEYTPAKDRGRIGFNNSSGPYFIDDTSRVKFEKLVTETFEEELSKSERFKIVDAPGPDVLMVIGKLLNITSFVPPERIGRSEIYLSTVGEATLVLELRDSETNTILARSIDRRAAETMGGELQWSTPVSNTADVKRLIHLWATRLRAGLDGFLQSE